MTSKIRSGLATATLLLLAAIWLAWPASQSSEPDEGAPRIAAVPAVAPIETSADASADTPERGVIAPSPPVVATTGRLVVRVRYADEPRPAPEVSVTLGRPGGDFRVDVLRARTDAGGVAQFDAVPAGKWVVATSRALGPKAIEVLAGQEHECILDLRRGMEVSGIVVDRWGTPVAGALIELGEARRHDPEVVATTPADGTFALRGCPSICLVGARAANHAASSLLHLVSHDGSPQRVRLELVAPGGVVEGLVLGEQGAPVAGAVVRVGEGPTDDLTGHVGSCPALPAQVRTDVDGRFVLGDLPIGEVELTAAVESLGRASAKVTTAPGSTARCELRLSGLLLRGRIADETDKPVAWTPIRVIVEGGDARGELAMADQDGRFRVPFLPEGCRVTIELVHHKIFRPVRWTGIDPAAGEAVVRVQREPRSARVRGVVLDSDGNPATSVTVRAAGEAVVTRADGGFEIGPLSAGGAWLYFEKDGYATYRSALLTLSENATVDLGSIRLQRGGHVRVEVYGASAEQLTLVAHGVHGDGVGGTGIVATTVPIRSIPLHPGGYELRVSGKGFAPQRLPFTIRDGEETELTLAVTPGIEQRFEFRVVAGGAVSVDRVAFEIRRGAAAVWSATARADRAFAVEASLAAGEYEVVVTQDGLRGSARFTVGPAPGPPIVVQVRP